MELRSPESGAPIVKISIDLRKSSKVLNFTVHLFLVLILHYSVSVRGLIGVMRSLPFTQLSG